MSNSHNLVVQIFLKDFSEEIKGIDIKPDVYLVKNSKGKYRKVRDTWNVNTHNIFDFVIDQIGLRGGNGKTDFNILHGKVCDKRNNEYFFGVDSIFNQQFEVCHYN